MAKSGDGRWPFPESLANMARTITFILVTVALLTSSANAQWRKVRDFIDSTSGINELITCVYFMDLPGPPRIGFVGTESELWKTTDGGISWKDVWPQPMAGSAYVIDICFKDSLTGWFSYPGAVYRTDDGGDFWYPVYNTPYAVEAIHYCAASRKLFLGLLDTMLVSTDLGNTWAPVLPPAAIFDFSFSSDSSGIASAAFGRDSAAILRTLDGGNTWATPDSMPSAGEGISDPLAIPGTPICFGTPSECIKVFRSDDYGRDWKQIADFGPCLEDSPFVVETGPMASGYIRGDLSRLYIASESGMYDSTDQGITWFNDGGPTDVGGGFPHEFYAGKGVTMAGWWGGNMLVESEGLWEETWPQSSVAEPPSASSSNDLRVFPNPAESTLQILSGPSGTARLFDLLGREVLEAPVSAGLEAPAHTLDVSRLLAGTYFLRLGGESAKVVIAR